MLLRTHVPGPPLDRFVDHMVYYSGHEPEHTRERALPDAGVYWLIDLEDRPKHIYDNERLVEIQSCRNSWLSGLQTRYITIEAGPDSSMLVTRFRPGGAFAFLGLPLQELRDLVIDSDLVFGSAIDDLRDSILEAETPEDKFLLVERFLLSRARSRLTLNGAVEFAVRELSREPAGATIERLRLETGTSRKHLAGLFSRWVGVSPKHFQRIVRFQSALAEIERSRRISWPSLALDCGFYDQAHFVNEFKHFCGLNPSQYLVDRGEYANFVPIR